MKKVFLLLSIIVISISVHAQAPVNDEPCNAIDVPVMSANDPINADCTPITDYIYNNATLTPAIPDPTCGNTFFPQNIRDVWYKCIILLVVT